MRGLDKQHDLAMMPSRMRHHPHGRDELVTWLIGRGMTPPIHTPDSGRNTWNRRNTMSVRLLIEVSDSAITWEELAESIAVHRLVTIDSRGDGTRRELHVSGILVGAQEVHT
jgi:hypothetical protein